MNSISSRITPRTPRAKELKPEGLMENIINLEARLANSPNIIWDLVMYETARLADYGKPGHSFKEADPEALVYAAILILRYPELKTPCDQVKRTDFAGKLFSEAVISGHQKLGKKLLEKILSLPKLNLNANKSPEVGLDASLEGIPLEEYLRNQNLLLIISVGRTTSNVYLTAESGAEVGILKTLKNKDPNITLFKASHASINLAILRLCRELEKKSLYYLSSSAEPIQLELGRELTTYDYKSDTDLPDWIRIEKK